MVLNTAARKRGRQLGKRTACFGMRGAKTIQSNRPITNWATLMPS